MLRPPNSYGSLEHESEDAASNLNLAPSTCYGEYVLVQAALPETNLQNVGILLLDSESDLLYCRFRRDFGGFAGDQADWFEALPDYITQKANELGARKCLEWMESTLSHTLRISRRELVAIEVTADATLDLLYAKFIRPEVLRFLTHLPQYSLEAAAGKFGRQMEVEPEGWVEVHTGLQLTDDMFVVHVEGHSMEPRIPDARLCAFRSKIVGSWDGKVLLFEQYGETGGNRYTVKLCHLSKATDANQRVDAAWLHQRVTLESINPDYPSWEVASADKVAPLGEFLFVV